jgi:hypothetical protein
LGISSRVEHPSVETVWSHVMPKSPLAIVAERFKNKTALIDAVKALATDDLWVDRVNDDKGLPHISNKKLIHLHDVLSTVKKDYGSRTKLIDAILDSEKRVKDAGYRARLETRSTPELLATLSVAKKRAAPAKAARPKAETKAAAPKKVAAKKPKAAAKPKAGAKAGAANKANKASRASKAPKKK